MHWISPNPLHLPLITYRAQIIHGWKKRSEMVNMINNHFKIEYGEFQSGEKKSISEKE